MMSDKLQSVMFGEDLASAIILSSNPDSEKAVSLLELGYDVFDIENMLNSPATMQKTLTK